jgi:hypothetical protein
VINGFLNHSNFKALVCSKYIENCFYKTPKWLVKSYFVSFTFIAGTTSFKSRKHKYYILCFFSLVLTS